MIMEFVDRSMCTKAEERDSNPVGPQPLAWRLAPPAYRRWLAERSIQLGERQAKGEMNAGTLMTKLLFFSVD